MRIVFLISLCVLTCSSYGQFTETLHSSGANTWSKTATNWAITPGGSGVSLWRHGAHLQLSHNLTNLSVTHDPLVFAKFEPQLRSLIVTNNVTIDGNGHLILVDSGTTRSHRPIVNVGAGTSLNLLDAPLIASRGFIKTGTGTLNFDRKNVSGAEQPLYNRILDSIFIQQGVIDFQETGGISAATALRIANVNITPGAFLQNSATAGRRFVLGGLSGAAGTGALATVAGFIPNTDTVHMFLTSSQTYNGLINNTTDVGGNRLGFIRDLHINGVGQTEQRFHKNGAGSPDNYKLVANGAGLQVYGVNTLSHEVNAELVDAANADHLYSNTVRLVGRVGMDNSYTVIRGGRLVVDGRSGGIALADLDSMRLGRSRANHDTTITFIGGGALHYIVPNGNGIGVPERTQKIGPRGIDVFPFHVASGQAEIILQAGKSGGGSPNPRGAKLLLTGPPHAKQGSSLNPSNPDRGMEDGEFPLVGSHHAVINFKVIGVDKSDDDNQLGGDDILSNTGNNFSIISDTGSFSKPYMAFTRHGALMTLMPPGIYEDDFPAPNSNQNDYWTTGFAVVDDSVFAAIANLENNPTDDGIQPWTKLTGNLDDAFENTINELQDVSNSEYDASDGNNAEVGYNMMYTPTGNDTKTVTGTDGALNTLHANTFSISPRSLTPLTLNLNGGTLSCNALMLMGRKTFSINNGRFGRWHGLGTRYIHVADSAGVLKTNMDLSSINIVASNPGNRVFNKAGRGFLELTGTSLQFNNPAMTGIGQRVNILLGTLRASNTQFRINNNGGVSTPSSTITSLAFRGGVFEITGGNNGTGNNADFERGLGVNAGQLNWASDTDPTDMGSGGFSAFGQAASVNINGNTQALTWGQPFFVQDGYALLFGSTQSNAPLRFLNPINLDNVSVTSETPAIYKPRVIHVFDNPNSSLDKTILTGGINGSSNTDLVKAGPGELEIGEGAFSSLAGNVIVAEGTLTLSSIGAVLGINQSGGGALIVKKGATCRIVNDDVTDIVEFGDLILEQGSRLEVINSSGDPAGLTLKIYGKYTNNGGTIVGNNNGTPVDSSKIKLLFQAFGATEQYADGVKISIDKAELNNNNSDLTLHTPVDIYKEYVPTDGLLKTNNLLTLKSIADPNGPVGLGVQTAMIRDASGNQTTTYIKDSVLIESYYPANIQRAWRVVTAPITNDEPTTIRQSWMEGSAPKTDFADYNEDLVTGFNARPRYGTLLTSGYSGADAEGRGFDVNASNKPSIYAYDNATFNFVRLNNTGIRIKDHQAYYMFVRGHRALGTQLHTQVTTPTTLRVMGKVKQRQQTIPVFDNNNWTIIGNPYASAIDFRQVAKNNVKDGYWEYKISPYAAGGAVWNQVVADPFSPTGYTGTVTNYYTPGIIEPGQGFFVERLTPGSAGSIDIDENAKTLLTAGTFKVPDTDISRLAIRVKKASMPNDHTLDGSLVFFGKNYSTQVLWEEEVNKAVNAGENIAISRAGKDFVVERRAPVQQTDTIPLHVWKTQKDTSYQLLVEPHNFPPSTLEARLEDKYLQKQTTLSLEELNTYQFSINSDSSSQSKDRFQIVFQPVESNFLNIQAVKETKGVQIHWTVDNEVNLQSYAVERSNNGTNFSIIGTVIVQNSSIGQSQYQYLDQQPQPGKNYYRIKAVSNVNSKYSTVVNVDYGNVLGINLKPNPTTSNKIQLEIGNIAAGSYRITLYDAGGKEVHQQNYQHQQGVQQLIRIQPKQILRSGVYQLIMKNQDNEYKQTLIITE